MVLMNDALFKLVVSGLVAPEEANIQAIDKSNFVALLKTRGITLHLTGGIEQ